jgi:two-component system cell cycle response regulator PopA
MRLANGHRRLHQLRESLINFKDLEGIDAPTQLFGRDLFAQHLSRLSDYSRQRNRPLSVCVLKIVETDAIGFARQKGYLDAALTQIGAMVSRLIRCEDTGGRLSNERFALALPATTFEKARLVCERIAAVISCTAFETKPGLPPYIVEFDVGVAELLRNEPPSEALLRAAENSRHNIHNQRFSAF